MFTSRFGGFYRVLGGFDCSLRRLFSFGEEFRELCSHFCLSDRPSDRVALMGWNGQKLLPSVTVVAVEGTTE